MLTSTSWCHQDAPRTCDVPAKITAPGYAIKFPFPTIAATKNSCAELQATMGSWPAGRDWPSGYEQKRCRGVVTNSNRRQEISKDWSASLVLSHFYAKMFEHSRGSRNKPWEILPQENYSTMFFANFWDGSKSLQNYQNIFYGQIPQKKNIQNSWRTPWSESLILCPRLIPKWPIDPPEMPSNRGTSWKVTPFARYCCFPPFCTKAKSHFYLCKIYHRPK